MKGPVRVLVVEDSPTVRAALTGLLSAEPGIRVVGEAVDGESAVKQAVELRPDVITMDLRMPGMGGLEAIAEIMSRAPARIVVVCSVTDDRFVDLSFRATQAGALELVAKPSGGANGMRAWGERVAEAVRLMAEVPVVSRKSPRASRPSSVCAASPVQVVAMVASTGGPPAIASILGGLHANVGVPILIAQHMARGFANGLVRWFSSVSKLPVTLAADGQHPLPGRVYLPPDGHHLLVDRDGTLRLRATNSDLCPSGDLLLESVAHAWASRAAGIVLTGMGSDGAKGLRAIREVGGTALAQDEASSVVFGMPAAAKALDASLELVPLDQIAPTLLRLTRST